MRPLRIAITHTRFSYTGGVEKYIYSLVERLLEAGHEIHYFAARGEEYTHPRFRFHRVPLIRYPPSLRVLSFDYFTRRLLRRHVFDLVHGFTKTGSQDIYTDGSGTLAEFLEATVPGPRWWRFLYGHTPHQRAILRMERRRFRRDAAYRIIPMARFVRDQILRRYPVDPSRVEVVYNGVELEHFHPRNRERLGPAFRDEHGIPARAPLLLFVGNDWQRKGLDTVLGALPSVAGSGPPPLLVVAGRDNHPSRFLRQARRHGISDQVLWVGPLHEVRDAFAAADLFVFPSRYDVFGNVGLEALASGVPVLLSRKAGVSEVLNGSVAGEILEDPEDSAALAAAITRLLDPATAAQRRHDARALAEPYSWDRHFERILEIYEEVLAEKRKRRNGP